MGTIIIVLEKKVRALYITFLVISILLLIFSVFSFPIYALIFSSEEVFRYILVYLLLDFVLLLASSIVFSTFLYKLCHFKSEFSEYVRKHTKK